MTQDVIKILFVTTGLRVGGAEMMLLKLLAGIDRRRFSPVVVSLVEVGPVGELIAREGILVHPLELGGKRGPVAALLRLRAIVREFRPDVIQGWMYHGNLAALLAVCLGPGRTPLFWSVRGTHTELGREKPGTAVAIWLGAKLSRLPQRIINNSSVSAKAHAEKLGYADDRWAIIPNGFDTDRFRVDPEAYQSVRAELGISAETLLVGLVARFHPVKDHATFLAAAALVRKTHPAVRFLLVGEGTESSNPELTKLIRQYALEQAVYLLGRRDDLPRLTAALDLACCSSLSEGFPNVLGEALACGVPCVSTDVGDAAWIIGEAGYIVPPQDPQSFAAAVLRIATQEREGRSRLGEVGQRRVAEFFSLPAVIRSYQKLYEQRAGEIKGSLTCAA